MFTATYKEGFATKYGNTIKVENQKGEWALYGKDMRPPNFNDGDEVEFEAEKKPSSNGKSYWHYSKISLKGAASRPSQSQTTPRGQPATGDAFRQMFIVGIVGRAMGSGKFDAADIEALTIAAAQAFDHLVSGHDAGGGQGEEIPY